MLLYASETSSKGYWNPSVSDANLLRPRCSDVQTAGQEGKRKQLDSVRAGSNSVVGTTGANMIMNAEFPRSVVCAVSVVTPPEEHSPSLYPTGSRS